MCYCYVRMSERDITTLNSKLLITVRSNSRDEVESLLDLGAEVDAHDDVVCY